MLARNAPGLGDPRKMKVDEFIDYVTECQFAAKLDRGMSHRERVQYLKHIGR